ncbi:YhzD family protein [Alteribacter aurantiacus]|uniref:YhzD family protein n=1 Tax=Alteribacter aurantiacus TaxID=254410 RepID=UPI000411AA6C|nr:YhzD family protein [Alteribacter aurantiacus]
MPRFFITAYDKNGEHLLNDSFVAENDQEAKKIGQQKLDEQNLSDHTSRVVRDSGGLVLFHI